MRGMRSLVTSRNVLPRNIEKRHASLSSRKSRRRNSRSTGINMKIGHISDGLYKVVHEIAISTRKKPDMSPVDIGFSWAYHSPYDKHLWTSTPDAPMDVYA